MTTKNTLSDLSFAEDYVAFMARRGATVDQRARASMVLAAISLLDRNHPTWRAELLTSLNDSATARDISEIFPIPVDITNSLVSQYLQLMKAR